MIVDAIGALIFSIIVNVSMKNETGLKNFAINNSQTFL